MNKEIERRPPQACLEGQIEVHYIDEGAGESVFLAKENSPALENSLGTDKTWSNLVGGAALWLAVLYGWNMGAREHSEVS